MIVVIQGFASLPGLPEIAAGRCLTSACLTEPGGGTDLPNMRTTAVKADGGWRLTGTKVFISHAAHAGLFFVVASIDLAQKHKGVTAFLVDPRARSDAGRSACLCEVVQAHDRFAQ